MCEDPAYIHALVPKVHLEETRGELDKRFIDFSSSIHSKPDIHDVLLLSFAQRC